MLFSEFEMKECSSTDSFLEVYMQREANGITLHQRPAVERILQKFNMNTSKPVTTPLSPGYRPVSASEADLFKPKELYQEAVGSLLYLSSRTRPDICAAVNILSRAQSRPTVIHWTAVKRVMRYLNGTKDYGMHIKKNSETHPVLCAYADANWAGDDTDRKSTSGFCVLLFGNVILLKTLKQRSIATSTTEAEYISLSDCFKQVRWVRNLLCETKLVSVEQPTIMYEDNTGVLDWAAGGRRAKHVELRYHFVQEGVQQKEIVLNYCCT